MNFSIKPGNWGFYALVRWQKGFLLLPSYYLHTVRDYTDRRTAILCLPISFFIWKLPQAFSIIFSISSLAWGENLPSQGSMKSRISPHVTPPLPPASTHILNIALGQKSDVPPPPYSPSPKGLTCFRPVLPIFLSKTAALMAIIFLFHQPVPQGQKVFFFF